MKKKIKNLLRVLTGVPLLIFFIWGIIDTVKEWLALDYSALLHNAKVFAFGGVIVILACALCAWIWSD